MSSAHAYGLPNDTKVVKSLEGTWTVKAGKQASDECISLSVSGLAKMLKGGVIMDVINAEQAR